MKLHSAFARIGDLVFRCSSPPLRSSFRACRKRISPGSRWCCPTRPPARSRCWCSAFPAPRRTPTGAWMKRVARGLRQKPGRRALSVAGARRGPAIHSRHDHSGHEERCARDRARHLRPGDAQRSRLKKLVNYKDDDDAYLVVLDRTGKVVYPDPRRAPDAPATRELRMKLQGLLK